MSLEEEGNPSNTPMMQRLLGRWDSHQNRGNSDDLKRGSERTAAPLLRFRSKNTDKRQGTKQIDINPLDPNGTDESFGANSSGTKADPSFADPLATGTGSQRRPIVGMGYGLGDIAMKTMHHPATNPLV